MPKNANKITLQPLCNNSPFAQTFQKQGLIISDDNYAFQMGGIGIYFTVSEQIKMRVYSGRHLNRLGLIKNAIEII
jgi:hypothetical protein